MASPAPTKFVHSPWSPFHHRTFAVIWTATVVANVGTWMYSAAAAWLMTKLTTHPLMVSLVQVATSLPGGIIYISEVVRKKERISGQVDRQGGKQAAELAPGEPT